MYLHITLVEGKVPSDNCADGYCTSVVEAITKPGRRCGSGNLTI